MTRLDRPRDGAIRTGTTSGGPLRNIDPARLWLGWVLFLALLAYQIVPADIDLPFRPEADSVADDFAWLLPIELIIGVLWTGLCAYLLLRRFAFRSRRYDRDGPG